VPQLFSGSKLIYYYIEQKSWGGKMAKYLVICGGVYSGSGKGISIASIGFLLSLRGHKVNVIKCDPYLNINAGILNPREHGECFLADDGSETDLDLGSYERIIGCEVGKENIITNGTLLKELMEEQENGEYLGQTVQHVPHVTNKILQRFYKLGEKSDIVLIEIGGTVGDNESHTFFQAVRQLKQNNHNDVLVGMVAPILWVNTIKEFKTKPLQNAVETISSFGLQPDFLLCRSEKSVPSKILDKISNLTNIQRDSIFEALDVSTIYQVPIEFYNSHIDDLIIDKFALKRNGIRIHKYKDLVEKYTNNDNLKEITIGIVAKYDNCDEAYLSLKEAIFHAAVHHDVRVNIKWINAMELESSKDTRIFDTKFENVDAIIVPGGFDSKGIEGKIKAINYVRNNKIPFLGICLGLQTSVIEFARNVLGKECANSTEFDVNCDYPIVHFVSGQESIKKKSGTMRLGAYQCDLTKDTLAFDLYKKKTISERHRHRYEVNNSLISDPDFSNNGLIVSGRHPETQLVEMIELKKDVHPFFIATQAHPEFKSRLQFPAPLFSGLINAAKILKQT